MGNIIQISDGQDHRLSSPAIASADSSKMIVVWTDQRNGFDQIMGQRLVDTVKVEGNFIITPEQDISLELNISLKSLPKKLTFKYKLLILNLDDIRRYIV